MPRKSFRARLAGFFILLALGSAVGVRMAQGQEISFLREFSDSDIVGVAVDATGVYVAGSRTGGFVRKHDLEGNELWTRTFDTPIAGIVVNAASVYLVRTVFGSNSFSSFLIKYDAVGNELWTRPVSGLPYSVAADGTGIYVLTVLTRSGEEGFLLKYSGDGEQLWRRSLSTDPTVWPRAAAADDMGIYVAGSGFLQKYSGAGETLWTRSFPVTSSIAVAAEATGVYVAGERDLRVILRKYDPSGNERWIREFDSSRSPQSQTGYPGVAGVAAEPSGVYIVGTTNLALADRCRSGLEDAFARKYDPNGLLLWTRQFSGSLDSAAATGVAVGAGDVYLIGVTGGCGPEGCNTLDLLAKLEGSQPVISEPGARILPGCVVNAASYIGGQVAPGEIVTIFGREIGPEEPSPARVEGSRLATTLAGTRVLVDGIAAPLLYVSGSQINAIVPYAVAERPAVNIEVEYQGVRSNVVTMPVTASRPGIFTRDGSGTGYAVVLNEDGSINSVSNPAEKGSVITFFATGDGLIEPAVEDGLILGSVQPKPKGLVSVLFCCHYPAYGPLEGKVQYAGGVSKAAAGLLQLNVRMPFLEPFFGPEGFQLCIGGQCSDFNQVFIKP